ncbi:hypothetical protein WA158_000692 [Blastocystis sp. Blastoise]
MLFEEAVEVTINWLKVGLSCGVAFIVAIAVCVGIEAFGGAVGGILGTVPSTILPASYVLLTEAKTEYDAIAGCFGFPLGASCSSFIFLPLWAWLPPRMPRSMKRGWRLFIVSVISVACWLLLGFFLTWLQQVVVNNGFPVYFFSPILTVLVAIEGVFFCWVPIDTPKGKKKTSIQMHLFRGTMTAIVIFCALMISTFGPSDIGGLISGFPIMFLISMVTISIAQDDSVTAGAVSPLIIGTPSGHIYVYVTACLYVYAHLDIAWSMIIGFIASVVCWSIPSYFFVDWRKRVKARKQMIVPVSSKVIEQIKETSSQDEKIEEIKESTTSNKEENKLAINETIISNDTINLNTPSEPMSNIPTPDNHSIPNNDAIVIDTNNNTSNSQ